MENASTHNKPSALLEMENISKAFGATQALKGVSLKIHKGEVHALIGENGAGKSTLMKILAGAYLPDAGCMFLEGKPYKPHSPLHARRAGICMIYQELALVPHLSVAENIFLGIEPKKFGFLQKSEMFGRARQALASLGSSTIEPEFLVKNLSPAECQITEIARSLVSGCKVLVLDEPTSSLNKEEIDYLFKIILKLKEQGVGIIYISHFLDEVKRVADNLTILQDGCVVKVAKASYITTEEIVKYMLGTKDYKGQSNNSQTKKQNLANSETLLEIKKLSGINKPIDVSLTLKRGEIVGIAGLLGSGRTELLRAIFGLDKIRKGEIKIASFFGWTSPYKRWQQGVGFLSEDRKNEGLALKMSVAENITLTNISKLTKFGFLSLNELKKQAEVIKELMGIKCLTVADAVNTLSGGNQQKVAIARLFFHNVDIMLLDEPARGIDVGSKMEIFSLLRAAARGDDRAGIKAKGIIVVSSYFSELIELCDRIIIVSKGRLVAEYEAKNCTEETLMLKAVSA